MPHLWTRDPDGEITVVTFDGAIHSIGDHGTPNVVAAGPQNEIPPEETGPVLMRSASPGSADYVLLAPVTARVRINGDPLRLGVRVLDDKDAIQFGADEVHLYSTERIARVEPFAGDSTRGVCPRCRQRIEPGTPAVRCPSCGIWHHQTADSPCWTGYEHEPFPTCAMDDQPATLGGELRWVPEFL